MVAVAGGVGGPQQELPLLLLGLAVLRRQRAQQALLQQQNVQQW